ncbi:recombinase family protein, partial [Paracoccus sp. WLY502]|uniref:recombinase family protein n=1 Tax=Paracoccus yibinensis TaxID=3068891 RepID=UPI002796503D
MAIEPQIMARMLTELARFEIAAFEQERAYAPARCPVAARCAMERQLAISEALRQALAVGDREVARAPLRTVARHLGIHLDESDIDWPALAYQASRVLVDIAKERARREDGQYINQSDWFQAGMNVAAHSARFTHVASADLLGSFALAGDRDHTPSQFASRPDATGCRAVEIKEGAQSCAQKTAGLKDHSSAATKYQPVEPNISTAAPMPLQKPPAERVNRPATVDLRKLSDGSCRTFKAGHDLHLGEMLTLHFELKALGYGNDWSRMQRPNPAAGKKWVESNLGKPEFAVKYWVEMLGDIPDRPDFLRLSADLAAGRFDLVLAESLDRISRPMKDTAEFYAIASFHGIAIHTVDAGEIDKLRIGITSIMAEMLIDNLRAKTHRGLRARVEAGQFRRDYTRHLAEQNRGAADRIARRNSVLRG